MPASGITPKKGTWGITLGIDAPVRVNISNGDVFHVCGACFGENPGVSRVVIRARVVGGAEDIVLCALTPGTIENAMLALDFRDCSVEFSACGGDGKVYLSGIVTPPSPQLASTHTPTIALKESRTAGAPAPVPPHRGVSFGRKRGDRKNRNRRHRRSKRKHAELEPYYSAARKLSKIK